MRTFCGCSWASACRHKSAVPKRQALFAERISDPLDPAGGAIDQEDVEARRSFGTARQIEARGREQALALRCRDAFGGLAKAAAASHAHFANTSVPSSSAIRSISP